MVRASIDLGGDTRVSTKPLAIEHGRERAIGLLSIAGGDGLGTIMGSPAELRALAAAAITAAEQAEEMIRVAELLADTGTPEHARV
jgi:hypothetical protein